MNSQKLDQKQLALVVLIIAKHVEALYLYNVLPAKLPETQMLQPVPAL